MTEQRARAEKLEELFQEALSVLPEQRAELLARRSGGDRELLERVRALLAEDERATRAELRPENLRAAGLTSERIGRYRLVRSLGEGGMGMVYLAEQEEPVRRLVALKTIRRSRLSSAVAARFAAECQALASMDHPGIAKVFDGGTTEEGVPWFVMEYAAGAPITAYCDRVRMPLAERLELLARVCDAVQHAHERGIVHRDLKPGNVLVESRANQAHARIVDFGIARALSSAPPAREEPPMPLSDSLGTPAYMSPERLLAGDPLVDTRDDVYSLGVMLHQLVTGRLPVEASDKVERLRALESDLPAPSARITALGPDAEAIAAARATTPRELSEELRGELDALVLMALARERTRRYASAAALAEDLRRFLRDEPLAALGKRPAYRARKFVRRHRLSLGLASALVLVLVLGLLGTVWGLVGARAARDEAERIGAAERSEREEADLLVRVFQEAIMMAQADADLQVADLLDQLAGNVRQLGIESPEAEAALHAALGRSFLALGDDRQALEQFESAYVRGGGLEEEDPFDRLDVLEGLIEATRRSGDRDAARTYVRQFVELARQAFADKEEHFQEPLGTLLALAGGAAVPGDEAFEALEFVLVCLEDGIVRGDESGALARVLVEAAAQLRLQRSPHAETFIDTLERRVVDLFPINDVRRLIYLWSLLHVRVLPPGEPLQGPAGTERSARALLELADARLAPGHWVRSDARRLLARTRIDRVRTSAAAGAVDPEAYAEARALLGQALEEALLTPRSRRAALVAAELDALGAARPEGMEPDPELLERLDEARAAAQERVDAPGVPPRRF